MKGDADFHRQGETETVSPEETAGEYVPDEMTEEEKAEEAAETTEE